MKNLKNNSIKPYPYAVYFTFTTFLTVAAIINAAYLVYTHYQNHTNLTYASFCAVSRTINCDTVAQSPWAVLGNLPVATWGLFGYLIFLLLLIPVRNNSQNTLCLWAPLLLLGLCYSFVSVFFGYIAVTKIKSYCFLCIISYGINFSLFYCSIIIRQRFDNNSLTKSIKDSIRWLTNSLPAKITTALLLFGIINCYNLYPHYWEFKTLPEEAKIPRGITENGHPWIGAKIPKLTIHEYSDYLCFQCFKMQHSLRELISKNPQTIRLVHHHYPLDHDFNPTVVSTPFHNGSGKMALLAIYATSKNKFWEMNDILFQLGRKKNTFNLNDLSEQISIPVMELKFALSSPDVKQMLNYDILLGMKKRITATPSFIINDTMYQGIFPKEIIGDIIK